MSNIPEFKFDYDKIEGKSVDEAMLILFGQMEAHYNAHVKPAPIIFGGKKLAAPVLPKTAVLQNFSPAVDGTEVNLAPAPESDRIPVTDWEIKQDATTKKDMLTGVRYDTKVEVFDVVQKRDGDLVIGDSGTYLLDRKTAK